MAQWPNGPMAQWPNGTGLGIRSRAAHRHGLQCGSPRLAAEESLVPWKTCGKHGENMGKTLENWKKLGDNVGKTYGKNWENYRADLRNLWESLWEIMETYMGTICGIIFGKKPGKTQKT